MGGYFHDILSFLLALGLLQNHFISNLICYHDLFLNLFLITEMRQASGNRNLANGYVGLSICQKAALADDSPVSGKKLIQIERIATRMRSVFF